MVKPNFYRDSLQLMKISDRLRRISTGILEASVVMATETNKGILVRLGFLPSTVLQANESDMLVAIRAKDKQSIDLAVNQLDELLNSPERIQSSSDARGKADNIDAALNKMPNTNLVLLSIPGEYVRDISLKLIDQGIHQKIFSDHVPIEDELEIKGKAAAKGVLILGPGAGTSIINGRGIGFSNAIKEGPVGIVAAAGTGLQEVTSLLDHCDIGVKHGLGVGGNDLKDKIGGIMMLECMKILEKDKDIRVIALVSKPPSPTVMRKIIDYAANKGTKRYVLSFIGGDDSIVGNKHDGTKSDYSRIIQVSSLTSSVLAVADAIGTDQLKKALSRCYVPPEELLSLLQNEWTRLQSNQKYIRALYTGGTFTFESQVILSEMIKDGSIYSNAPIPQIKQLEDTFKSREHSIIDLGEEEFTKGRPHPMIDPTIRKFRILDEVQDQEVAVILLDFVLGFGANPDPVGAVLDELKKAKKTAEESGRYLSVIAHVCGTKGDMQGYEQSISNLKSAGCIVLPTNALAAVASAVIVSRGNADLAHIYNKYLELPHSWEEV
jgi:succinyl-CoA synthetase alpha subunit